MLTKINSNIKTTGKRLERWYCNYSADNSGVYHATRATWCTDYVKCGRAEGTKGLQCCAKSHVDVAICGDSWPQAAKTLNFANLSASYGQMPCSIFVNFIDFMCYRGFHKCFTFGAVCCITEGLVSEKLQQGNFPPNFLG